MSDQLASLTVLACDLASCMGRASHDATAQENWSYYSGKRDGLLLAIELVYGKVDDAINAQREVDKQAELEAEKKQTDAHTSA